MRSLVSFDLTLVSLQSARIMDGQTQSVDYGNTKKTQHAPIVQQNLRHDRSWLPKTKVEEVVHHRRRPHCPDATSFSIRHGALRNVHVVSGTRPVSPAARCFARPRSAQLQQHPFAW